MINIKKVNIEFILSAIFFLLMFYETVQFLHPLFNLNFLSNLVSFEVDFTWGNQLTLTQDFIIMFICLFILFVIILRIRQIRRN